MSCSRKIAQCWWCPNKMSNRGIVRSIIRYYAVGRREDSRAPCSGHCTDVVYDAAGTHSTHVDAPTTRNYTD